VRTVAGESAAQRFATFRWVGSEAALLDTPTVVTCGRVAIGRYGGHSGAGARSNEDGALVWCAMDGSWELAALLDAHFSAESAELVLAAIEGDRAALLEILAQPVETLFAALHQRLLALFRAPSLRAQLRRAEGEASCLLCARKGPYLWWLSIGDCVIYLFHPWLAQAGQTALNQRSFSEWIGQRNTFELPVPCYASGVRRLLEGPNTVLMATDGLLECPGLVYEREPLRLYSLFSLLGGDPAGGAALADPMRSALEQVHANRGRDSATLIAWRSERGDPPPTGWVG
jgi:hypothetical protein